MESRMAEILFGPGQDIGNTQITVCRQIGNRTPQPPLKMTHEQALKFIKDSSGFGIELHTCYEAGPFSYHLHRTLEGMGIKTSSSPSSGSTRAAS